MSLRPSEIFSAPLSLVIAEIERAAAQIQAGEQVDNGYVPFKKRQYPDRVLSPYNNKGTHDRIDELSTTRPRDEVLRKALALGLDALENRRVLEESAEVRERAPFNSSLYNADTGTEKGRGVFAARAFKAHEVVEVCPVVIIRSHTDTMPPEVRTLVFDWKALANMPGCNALALGFGSLYNHSNPANMRYQADPSGQSLHFIAVRDIAAGEELTVNYSAIGGGPEWHNNNWFDRMGIKPI